jgi:hypothetical protein
MKMLLTFALLAGSLYGAGPCSNATVEGNYGYAIRGLRPVGPNGPVENIVGTLIRRFDGAGNFTQTDNVHGAVSGIVLDRPGTGTYEIKEDCTGVVKLFIPGLPFTIDERIVVVNNGDEILGATAAPAAVLVTSTGKRISSTHRDAIDRLAVMLQRFAFRFGIILTGNNAAPLPGLAPGQ